MMFSRLMTFLAGCFRKEEPCKKDEKVPDARLFIPQLDIAVRVFKRPVATAGNGQEIVDAIDSAVYFNMGALEIIADHCDQSNFGNLVHSEIGKTKAFLVWKDHDCEYECVGVEVGHITIAGVGNRLYDGNWNPIYTHQDGLCIYTCLEKSAPDVMDVQLTFWKSITR